MQIARSFKTHRSNIYVILFVFRAKIGCKNKKTIGDVTRKYSKKYPKLRWLKNPPIPPTGPYGQTSGPFHRVEGTITVATD